MIYSRIFFGSLLFAILIFNFGLIGYHYSTYATTPLRQITTQSPQGPIINDPKLKAEVVFRGLNFPTSMAFLGPNDILVLEKNEGTVRRIVNGTMLPNPLLHVNVATEMERGMLGIAVAKNNNGIGSATTTYVFLYYTENGNNLTTSDNFLRIDNQSRLPTNWNDPSKNCEHIFKCTINSTTGWGNNKNDTSFQLSTNTTSDHVWSWVYSKEIDVKPGEQYQLVTHMRLNEFVKGSHIVVEGYNNKTNQWDEVNQITQCPSGTTGPLIWHEFSCLVTIRGDTTKIRLVLNAGLSSQPGKQAITLFDDISLSKWNINNRLYRYELVNGKLANPKLLLNLPATSFIHNGGKIEIGFDKNVYIVIGNMGQDTTTQNILNGKDANGTGGILRITQNGQPVGKGIIGDKFPMNLYYAYGIRNSFGISFDPVTGKLWDTENGAECCDEINLVNPGFNSGWNKVQGIWQPVLKENALVAGPIELNPLLLDFGGKGTYHAPEFIWNQTVGATALRFLTSDKLGTQYKDDIFVGDFHLGNLYHFKLDQSRTGLALSGPLASKIAVNNKDPVVQSIVFGHGFGGITDVQVSPDGYLYILSLHEGGNNCDRTRVNGTCITYSSALPGTIFRILPAN